MKGKLIMIFVGAFIALAPWIPLWMVEQSDPQAMPVGLGLIAIAGSFVGGLITLVGLIKLMTHAFRGSV